jgi:hypothetical protein
MRIPDHLNGPRSTPETPHSSAEKGPRLDRAGNGDKSQGAVKGTESSQHFPAPEIVELTSQLREMPDVRQELVARVAKQLQSGSYLTREAAERTAARLLGEAG